MRNFAVIFTSTLLRRRRRGPAEAIPRARARCIAQRWLKRGYEAAAWRTGDRRRMIKEYEAGIARPLRAP